MAVRREFEPVDPTMLKSPIGARWVLLHNLRWGKLLFVKIYEIK